MTEWSWVCGLWSWPAQPAQLLQHRGGGEGECVPSWGTIPRATHASFLPPACCVTLASSHTLSDVPLLQGAGSGPAVQGPGRTPALCVPLTSALHGDGPGPLAGVSALPLPALTPTDRENQ